MTTFEFQRNLLKTLDLLKESIEDLVSTTTTTTTTISEPE